MRRVLLPAAFVLVGCAYQPGSYRYPRAAFAGTRATLGCVDLSIARRPVADDGGGIVLQFEFGNRCDQPQMIDLANVHVIGRTHDGREARLVAYDPDAELTPLPIDGKSYGAEAIAYRDPRRTEVSDACADLSTIVHASAPHWVCVGGVVAR